MVLVKDVGHRLPALRKERGLTQAALAELIGHSEVAVRSIERGASAPSFETLGRLPRGLVVPAVRSYPSAEIHVLSVRHARRSAARCVGKACVSKGNYRWAAEDKKKKE